MKDIITLQNITSNLTTEWYNIKGEVVSGDARSQSFKDFIVLNSWSGASGTLNASIELWGKVGSQEFKIDSITADSNNTSLDSSGFNVLGKIVNAVRVKVIMNACTQLTNFKTTVDFIV
jgi:hypothetical protein